MGHLDLKVPADASPASGQIKWTVDTYDLGWRGVEIKPEFSPNEGGKYDVRAVDDRGGVLCGLTVYLHAGGYPEVHPLGEASDEEQMEAHARELEQERAKRAAEQQEAAAALRAAQDRAQEISGKLAAVDKKISERPQTGRLGMALPPAAALIAERNQLLAEQEQAGKALAEANVRDQEAANNLLLANNPPLAMAAPPTNFIQATNAPPPDSVNIDVFFATERAFVNGAYLAQRETDKHVNYGRTTVWVPRTHKRGSLPNPVDWSFNPHDFWAAPASSLTVDTFYQQIKAELGKLRPASSQQVLIFIHGFNNGFVEDLYKTAQLKFDTGFQGQVILWDWPSQGRFSPTAYGADWETASHSIDDLAAFLRTVQQNTGATTVNLVAHSMGCHLLLETLDRMATEGGGLPKFGQVFLAAPDIGEAEFAQILPHLESSGKFDAITLYGSRRDLAMIASEVENRGWHPAGLLPPYNHVGWVDQIDASGLQMNLLGHDYFLTTRAVLDDMATSLRTANPMPRHGVAAYGAQGARQWRFLGQ